MLFTSMMVKRSGDPFILTWLARTGRPAQGRVGITCTLPRRVLKEGCYRIEFLSCVYFKKYFHEAHTNGPPILRAN